MLMHRDQEGNERTLSVPEICAICRKHACVLLAEPVVGLGCERRSEGFVIAQNCYEGIIFLPRDIERCLTWRSGECELNPQEVLS